MATRDVDVAVIGAGTAGLAAYRAAVARGASAVVIEAAAYGTTCARVGCMPSKLLIAAADVAHKARHAGGFGVTAPPTIDGRAVMDRVRRERDRFVGFVVDGVAAIPAEDKIRGRAHFTRPGELVVVDGEHARSVQARAVVVATGSAPFVPSMFDVVKDRVVVNDDVFDWEALPASVAVFGAGVIGLELGQALARLGVRVRIFGKGPAVGPLTDPVVREAAARVLGEELSIHRGDVPPQVSASPDGGVRVRFVDAHGNAQQDDFEFALVAAGRRPNLAGLGLERAGSTFDARGVPGFDRSTLRVGSTNVFLAGDVNDDVPLLHEAADEGRIAGDNAARLDAVTPGRRRSLLAIAFTDPQIAVVGGTYASLAGRDFAVGSVDFGDQGRSRVMLENRGVARLYAERGTRRFLGAELIAPRGEHLAHLLAWAHQAELTVDQMLAMPFYHPVVEEGLRTALRDVAARLP